MISLRKYLSSSLSSADDELHSTSVKAAAILLNGIATQSINADALDHEMFQMKLWKMSSDFVEASPNTLEPIAAAAVQAMAVYNRGIEDGAGARLREMQAIVGMLTRTLVQETDVSEKAVANLESIIGQLEKVYQIDDVRVVKLRLAETLKELHEETARQKVSSATLAKDLKSAVSKQPKSARAPLDETDDDAATGRLGSRTAQKRLAEAFLQPADQYAVIFSVDRLELVRSRFGSEAADQILTVCGAHIAEHLGDGDQFFRWKGPGYFALIKRAGPVDAVRSEIKRLAATKISHSITMRERSVLLPVGSSWAVLPLHEFSSVELLIEKLDSFVADSGQRS
ncbi:MAG: diguanylate cyclase [Acidobacteriota bacterium]|nr:diguanylate cyclase [Acidobacteriota bacterium]